MTQTTLLTFAQRVEIAAEFAYKKAAPCMASKAEICNAIQPVITDLQKMPRDKAIAYIKESFSHIGHQGLAIRMFKGQPV
jgi:hypothetical protein